MPPRVRPRVGLARGHRPRGLRRGGQPRRRRRGARPQAHHPAVPAASRARLRRRARCGRRGALRRRRAARAEGARSRDRSRSRCARLGRGAARTPEAWPGLDDLVRQHRAAVGGTWEEQRRVAIAVDTRALSAVAFTVEEGGCSDALVVPDDDVAVVDVDVLDADGRLVGRAKDGGPARSVTVCSPIALNGSLQVRPHVGRGLVAVVVAKTKAGGERDLLTRPDVAWVAPAQPLEATRAARNALLAKAGYAPPSSSHDRPAPARASRDRARRDDRRRRLYARRRRRRRAARAGRGRGLGRRRRAARLERRRRRRDALRLRQGEGARRPRDTRAARSLRGPHARRALEGPRLRRASARCRAHARARRDLRRSRSSRARPGRCARPSSIPRTSYVQNASIAAGQCLRVAIGVEGDGTGLEARLFDAVTGEEIDRSHGQNAAVAPRVRRERRAHGPGRGPRNRRQARRRDRRTLRPRARSTASRSARA